MIIYYDQVDSTNRIAKELLLEGEPSGTVVHAGRQSAGKGQYGRTFTSPAGGLYFSLLLRPKLDLSHLPLVTIVTGLACRDVIHSTFNLQPQIKWPNDIYLDGKKLAGILCENILSSTGENVCANVVIGVGLNINNTTKDFPSEVQPLITTLFDHLKFRVDLPSLLFPLVTAIKNNVTLLGENRQGLIDQWQQHDFLYKKPVICTAGAMTIQGIGLGISSEGNYRIQDNQGREHSIVGGQLRPNPAAY